MAMGPIEFVQYVYNIPHNFKPTSARWLLDSYPDYPVYAVVIYLVCVFYLPDFLKKRNLQFDLKWFCALWNFCFATVSAVGAYYLLDLSYEFLHKTHGWHNSMCVMMPLGAPAPSSAIIPATTLNENLMFDPTTVHQPGALMSDRLDPSLDYLYPGPRAFYLSFFMYLKTPELFDTILLMLQGKPFSFLQWWHHISTAIFCWHASYVLIPSGLFFAAMNYFVHAIMYAYFCLVVLGFRQQIRWFAPVVTLLQVVQMFAGITIVGYCYLQYWLAPWKRGTLFYNAGQVIFSSCSYVWQQVVSMSVSGSLIPHHAVKPFRMEENFIGCETDATNLRMAVVMYGTYCVLFVLLFRALYCTKVHDKNSIVLQRKARREEEDKEKSKKQKEEAAARASDGIAIAPPKQLSVDDLHASTPTSPADLTPTATPSTCCCSPSVSKRGSDSSDSSDIAGSTSRLEGNTKEFGSDSAEDRSSGASTPEGSFPAASAEQEQRQTQQRVSNEESPRATDAHEEVEELTRSRALEGGQTY